MFLESIKLVQFKNYSGLTCAFDPELNCLVGDNGAGKTNLLDAIHYLSFSRSAFNVMDHQNVQHSASHFSIEGGFKTGDLSHRVYLEFHDRQRKRISIDGKELQRSADLVGRFPVVLVAPNDLYALMERSETRRRFFDMIISQLDRSYLEALLNYNRVLRQRNSLLKNFNGGINDLGDLLDVYDGQLVDQGIIIASRRSEFCREFVPLMRTHFQEVSEGRESTDLHYRCAMPPADAARTLKTARDKDMLLQRTTVGVHRDDYEFEIGGYPLKKFGSQGQQKSFLIALKFAQFDVLHQYKGTKPIVLLDDVFDKLDDGRIKKLLEMIEDHTFGQVFITDARPERTMAFVRGLSAGKRLFSVASGGISELNV